nr:helix-turn-helix transcriptional regulator [Actinocrispum wychmicini]
MGRELRRRRELVGVSQDEAAKYAGLKGASISRMETGKQAILPRSVRLLCQRYNVGAPDVDMLVRQAEESNERAWYQLYSDTVPHWVESFLGLEAEATELWVYEAELVPGLLQTPEYVRAVAAAAQLDSTDAEIERSVELRLARQRRLSSDNPPRLRAVLNEAVIRRTVGGYGTMAAQLRRLVEMNRQGNIALQLLPFDTGAHVAMTGAFTMLRFPDELEMNAVFLEHDHGATSAERPADLDRYGRMFDRLASQALSVDQTQQQLAKLAEEYVRASE